MANVKMTQAQALEIAINVISGVDISTETATAVTEKLITMHDNIVKKNSTRSSKPTAKQLENEEIKAKILEVLTNAAEPVTVKTIMENIGYSSQKITALLTAMVADNKVINTKVKKISYYEVEKTAL